jgi:hypothetical protein
LTGFALFAAFLEGLLLDDFLTDPEGFAVALDAGFEDFCLPAIGFVF